jgi:hypothetical protein
MCGTKIFQRSRGDFLVNQGGVQDICEFELSERLDFGSGLCDNKSSRIYQGMFEVSGELFVVPTSCSSTKSYSWMLNPKGYLNGVSVFSVFMVARCWRKRRGGVVEEALLSTISIHGGE